MTLPGLDLARKLEGLAVAEMRRFVSTGHQLGMDEAALLEVAGGVATYLGADSPVNRAIGLGMSGPVSEAEVAELERFFLTRGVQPYASICPLAHATLMGAMGRRGWGIEALESVLVRELRSEIAPATAAGIEIREALTEEERDLWALVAATGFSDPLPPLAQQLAVARIVVNRPGARLFLAFIDGNAAGTGELYVEDGVAWLSADTTLPQFRGRGVQQALQRHRLAEGAALGCVMAATEAMPGSGSLRNMERVGFAVVYTRTDMSLPAERTP